jgi:hypothetical protein
MQCRKPHPKIILSGVGPALFAVSTKTIACCIYETIVYGIHQNTLTICGGFLTAQLVITNGVPPVGGSTLQLLQ